MQERRLTWMIGATLFAVLVSVAAVLAPPMRPDLGPDDATPGIASIALPSWSAGDRWTYRVTVGRASDTFDIATAESALLGTFTKTVVGTVDAGGATAYNVTLAADLSGSMAVSTEDSGEVQMTSANLEGYSWYRTSDLAKIRDVRTLSLEGRLETMYGTANVSWTVWADTSYGPAWDLWAFPIEANETWPVGTNATVELRTAFRLDGPDLSFEYTRNASFVVPIAYTMQSGTAENVTTPAGTFETIRTFVSSIPDDVDPDMATALSLVDAAPHASLEAWVSPDVENVVRVVGTIGSWAPLRLEVTLVSYAVA
jgi:hypothetical protein